MIMAAVSKMGVAGCALLNLGYKPTASITGTFLCRSKCYLLSDMLWVTILSFGRTAHVRIGHVTQSNSCSVKHLISFLRSYGPSSPDLKTTMSTTQGSDWLTFGAMCSKVLST